MSERRQVPPGRRLPAYILITFGVLWCLLCGSCGLLFSWPSIRSGNLNEMQNFVRPFMLLSTMFAIPGLGIVVLGVSLLRPKP